MKVKLTLLLAFALTSAGAAFSEEGGPRRIGCYKKMLVPAEYSVTKTKIKDSYQKYVKRADGVIELLEYPPVYQEHKKLVKEAHYLMRQIKCSGGSSYRQSRNSR